MLKYTLFGVIAVGVEWWRWLSCCENVAKLVAPSLAVWVAVVADGCAGPFIALYFKQLKSINANYF